MSSPAAAWGRGTPAAFIECDGDEGVAAPTGASGTRGPLLT